MIKITHKGDFSNTESFLQKIKRNIRMMKLEECGREGVEALSSATPKDSGLTANSWYYKIEETETSCSISFCNSNINKGVPIAIILQYGHGTRNGGYVEGIDYINPAIQPVFEKIVKKVWKEVTNI